MRNFVRLLEIVEVVVGGITLLGIFVYFHACGKHNDVYPSCHWAQNVVMAITVLLILLALLSVIMPAGRLKAGISIAMVPTALLMCIIPVFIIPICAGANMNCVSRFRPFTIVMGLAMAGLALVHTLFAIISSRPPKEEKKKGEDIKMSSRRRKHTDEDVQEIPVDDEWTFDDPEGIE